MKEMGEHIDGGDIDGGDGEHIDGGDGGTH